MNSDELGIRVLVLEKGNVWIIYKAGSKKGVRQSLVFGVNKKKMDTLVTVASE